MEKIIAEAIKFGAFKHRYQLRNQKGREPIPYFNHPIEVMYILAVEAGIEDTDILVTAILHDTIEDTDTTMEELAMKFGPKIAELVGELSDDQSPSTEERYAAQLRKTPLYSHGAKLVKLADRIANTRDAVEAPVPSWTQERVFGHFQQSRRQVDMMSGTHEILEKLFNDIYAEAEKQMQAANSA